MTLDALFPVLNIISPHKYSLNANLGDAANLLI